MIPAQIPAPPIPVPRPSSSIFQILVRVYGYLKPYWKHTAGAYASLLGILALNSMIPQLIRWIIDMGIEKQQQDVLVWSVLGLLGLTLLKGVLNYFQGVLSETSSQNVAFDLRNELQKKLTGLSFSFHDQSETGELLSRAVQDVERVRFLTGRATIRILDGVLMLLVTSIIMIVMDWRLALLIFITMPFLIYQAFHFGYRFRPLSLQVQKQLARLTTTLEQSLRGNKLVKAYAQEEEEIARFCRENDHLTELSIRAGLMQAINVPLLFFIANMGTVAIILYGGLQVMGGELTIGEVIAFITYVGQLIEPVRRLGQIIPAVSIAGVAAERIFNILDTTSDVRDEADAEPLETIRGDVVFENVSFNYGKRRVLRDVSFEIRAGQTVALLGSTGSGKSSIINLIPRFYDPAAGRILMDGKDIRHVTLHSLRSQIGIVLQETILFAATIRENIAFGKADATDEEIFEAARAAQAHNFILQMKDGYHTRIGERGVTLSGGQKQRIAIARALLMDPRVLLLDDATSSVDTETENLIQRAFARLVQERTTFVIAHRLSTVRNADLILVLDGGRVAARGTHETLLASSNLYRTIYHHQFKGQEAQP